jgi:hypothetical protein
MTLGQPSNTERLLSKGSDRPAAGGGPQTYDSALHADCVSKLCSNGCSTITKEAEENPRSHLHVFAFGWCGHHTPCLAINDFEEWDRILYPLSWLASCMVLFTILNATLRKICIKVPERQLAYCDMRLLYFGVERTQVAGLVKAPFLGQLCFFGIPGGDVPNAQQCCVKERSVVSEKSPLGRESVEMAFHSSCRRFICSPWTGGDGSEEIAQATRGSLQLLQGSSKIEKKFPVIAADFHPEDGVQVNVLTSFAEASLRKWDCRQC